VEKRGREGHYIISGCSDKGANKREGARHHLGEILEKKGDQKREKSVTEGSNLSVRLSMAGGKGQ